MFRTTNRRVTIEQMPSKGATLPVNRNKQRQLLASSLKHACSTRFRGGVTPRDDAVPATRAGQGESAPRASLAREPARPCSFAPGFGSVAQAGGALRNSGRLRALAPGPRLSSAVHGSPPRLRRGDHAGPAWRTRSHDARNLPLPLRQGNPNAGRPPLMGSRETPRIESSAANREFDGWD